MKNTVAIPTAADWEHHPDDLDAAYAYGNFHGKTLTEAFELFVENSLHYQEDIMFMPTRCFYFYAHAYIDYLLSDQSEGDSDGASCFFGIVEIRKDDIRRGPGDLRCRIRELLRRLEDRQAWYDAEPEIYGSFRDRADTCLKMIQA